MGLAGAADLLAILAGAADSRAIRQAVSHEARSAADRAEQGGQKEDDLLQGGLGVGPLRHVHPAVQDVRGRRQCDVAQPGGLGREFLDSGPGANMGLGV